MGRTEDGHATVPRCAVRPTTRNEGRYTLLTHSIAESYLAVPPSEFGPIVEGLRAARLVAPATPAGRESGAFWTRVVFEKPFGHDLASARALNDAIASAFDEPQVFRIDHYLGKGARVRLTRARCRRLPRRVPVKPWRPRARRQSREPGPCSHARGARGSHGCRLRATRPSPARRACGRRPPARAPRARAGSRCA